MSLLVDSTEYSSGGRVTLAAQVRSLAPSRSTLARSPTGDRVEWSPSTGALRSA